MNQQHLVRGHGIGGGPSYPFRRYIYNGDLTLDKDPDVKMGRAPKPKQPPKPIRREFSPDACGTPAGHQRHLYWDVPICDPCRDAKTKYNTERKARIRARKEAAK